MSGAVLPGREPVDGSDALGLKWMKLGIAWKGQED